MVALLGISVFSESKRSWAYVWSWPAKYELQEIVKDWSTQCLHVEQNRNPIANNLCH